MSYYKPSPKFETDLVARSGYDGVGGITAIGTGFKNFLTGTLDVVGHGLDVVGGRPQQPYPVQAESEVPWIPILAVTGLAIGAIVLLRKK
jgi:hypothetical protein